MKSLAVATAGLFALACKRSPEPARTVASSAPSPTPTPSVAVVEEKEAGPRAPAGPPADLNVLLITIDSLRADMPWAGYERPIAPRLTALEAKSVSYTHAYSLSSYTSMSLGGLLGGRLPSELKRDGFFFGTYPSENLFFPEVLHKAGIRTVSAHAHWYFGQPNFKQGFDVADLVPNLKVNGKTDENITSGPHLQVAEKILGDPANTGGRFFAWFHFMDPHDRYLPHPGIGPYGRKLRDIYDAEVTYTDEHLGKLLDFVAEQPWAGRTAIIVSADHGEALGEHGQYVHGFELWENLVRVPLFFLLPGVAPRHIDVARSAIDLAPTILDLYGLPPEPSFKGTSLVKELYGGEADPRDVVCDLPTTSDSGRRRALIHEKWKLIVYENDNAARLFDLETDPGEMKPIQRGEDFQAMMARYRELARGIKDVPPYRCAEGCLNGAYNRKDGGQ